MSDWDVPPEEGPIGYDEDLLARFPSLAVTLADMPEGEAEKMQREGKS
jgi:hypothetical protein